jgi:hypothetical protein
MKLQITPFEKTTDVAKVILNFYKDAAFLLEQLLKRNS